MLGLARSPAALTEAPKPSRRCGEPLPTARSRPAKASGGNHCGIRSDNAFCRVEINLRRREPRPTSSERGSGLKPPSAKRQRKANVTRIPTRARPDPGSALGEEKLSRAWWGWTSPRTPRVGVLQTWSQRLPFPWWCTPGSKPPPSGQRLGFKTFLVPHLCLSGRKINGAMLRMSSGRSGPAWGLSSPPAPSSSPLSAPLLAPPHLPARYRPRGHGPADSGRWMGPSRRRGAWDTCGDVTDAGELGRRWSILSLHQSRSQNPVQPTGDRGFPLGTMATRRI